MFEACKQSSDAHIYIFNDDGLHVCQSKRKMPKSFMSFNCDLNFKYLFHRTVGDFKEKSVVFKNLSII